MTPIVLFLFVPPLLLLALVPYTWRHRTTPGAKSFLMLVFAVVAWGICYALQLATVPDLAIKSFWSAAKYVGITITPVVWFVFALPKAPAAKDSSPPASIRTAYCTVSGISEL